MKKLLLSVGVVLTSLSINAQIVNGDLTTWASGEPSNWVYDFGGTTGVQPGTNNFLSGFGESTTTDQITGAGASGGTGSSALLETKAAVTPTVINAGFNQIPGMLLGEWAYTGTPASVSFDFIAQPAVDDTSIVWVTLYDANGDVVADAFAGWLNANSTTAWDNLDIPFEYVSSNAIAKVEVYCVSSFSANGTEVVGSKLSVDNFMLNGSAAGVDENSSLSVSAFPNPASEVLNIKLNTNATSVSVIGMDGKVVSTEFTNAKTVSVNVSNLVAGVYFYEIVSENGEVVRNSFVKK